MTPPYIQPGPCVGCGATGYPLSMGGPTICAACDCMPPQRRVKGLAEENRRLRALLAEHGIDPRPASMLQAVTFAGDEDDSARRVRFRPVDEAADEW